MIRLCSICLLDDASHYILKIKANRTSETHRQEEEVSKNTISNTNNNTKYLYTSFAEISCQYLIVNYVFSKKKKICIQSTSYNKCECDVFGALF